MSNINKFDALAYAISKLGQPCETSKNRYILVSNWHKWRLPCGRWLEVDEWSDGDQSTYVGASDMACLSGVRNNDDGSLCPDYEEEARALIDAYAEALK